jgi:hypothetical protein
MRQVSRAREEGQREGPGKPWDGWDGGTAGTRLYPFRFTLGAERSLLSIKVFDQGNNCLNELVGRVMLAVLVEPCV